MVSRRTSPSKKPSPKNTLLKRALPKNTQRTYRHPSRSLHRRTPMLAKRITQSIVALTLSFCAFLFMASGSRMSQIINVLSAEQFPFEMLLLEGMPSLAQPQQEQFNETRAQTLTLGLFLLTGVNIADQRTYFLHYLSPPQEGPAWLGWAYYPKDPELEGTPQDTYDDDQPEDSAPPSTPPSVPDYAVAPGTIQVGMYNTHSAESYVGDGGTERAEKGTSGDICDFSKSLAAQLNAMNIATAYDTSVNDTDFTKAYSASYKVAKNLNDSNPDMRLLLDIHRDGLPEAVGKRTVKINGKETARIMIIVGQKHDNWKINDALAQELIRIGEEKYPGLFLPRVHYASDARYNQHISSGATLLEIGSQLNTAEEAMNAAEPLAEVLKEYLQQ